ncbi:MAG: hypothetical protein E7373_04475 [Clostridiales bacterium]|nr:hypothetical protein [Clostridiales bacterium]
MKTYDKNKELIIKILLSALIGTVVGVLIFAFKCGAEFLYNSSDRIFSFTEKNFECLPIVILGVIFLSYLSYILLKREPYARGGGIPVAEGLVRNNITFSPFKVGSKAFLSSYVSYFGGLPLGSEGPAVLLGSCVGSGFNKIIKNKTDNALVKAGSACAFSAVTGAPIAGVFFIEEEMHDGGSFKKLVCVITAIAFSCLTSVLLCLVFDKTFAMFGYDFVEVIPIKYYYLAVICGLIAGVLSYLFTKLFTFCNGFSIKKLKKVPLFIKLLICFLVCAVLSVFVHGARGNGHHLIESIELRELNYKILITVLFAKLLMLCFVGGSGASGGIFIPLLALGSLLGGLLGECCIAFGVSETVYAGLIGAVTVAFLAGAQHSPLTALFFSIEAMGGLKNAPFTMITILIAFLVVKLFKNKPIYDLLFENLTYKK